MKPDELRRRLMDLGYLTQLQMAGAIYGAEHAEQYQANVSRYLSGERPVPVWMDQTVRLLEHEPPIVLSAAMRTALRQADRPGDPVPPPDSPEPHIQRVNWPRVYAAMKTMGAVHYTGPVPLLTKEGWEALNATD